MTAFDGLNIHARNIRDKAHLFQHLIKRQPRALVVMDDYGTAEELKRLLPKSLIIFRIWGIDGDENDYLQMTPHEWLYNHRRFAGGGIALYALNEPPFNEQVIKWLTELCTINLEPEYRLTLVLGNFATGNPKPEEWALAKDLLTLMAAHRDLFILGLHQYAGGVVTSGLYGGNPNAAGSERVNLIPPANWPRDLTGVTRFHIGREKFLVDYCRDNGIALPRIIATEGIFDDTSDIGSWLKTLVVSPPFTNIRGYKTLRAQWALWFPQWTLAQAYFEQLKYAVEVIWKDSPVEAVCLFSWGASSNQWAQFDIQDETELHTLLEGFSMASVTTLFPASTDPRMRPALLKSTGTTTNLRRYPNRESDSVLLFKTATATYIPAGLLTEQEKHVDQLDDGKFATWLPAYLSVDDRTYSGWVRDNAVLIQPLPLETPPAPPPIVAPMPEPELPTIDWGQDLAAIDAMLAVAEKERATVVERVSEANHQLDSVDTRIRLLHLLRDDISKLLPPDEMKASA